jgi:hypothetical protein
MYFEKAESNCSYFLSHAENVYQQHRNIDTAYPEIIYSSPFICMVYCNVLFGFLSVYVTVKAQRLVKPSCYWYVLEFTTVRW